MVGKIFVLGIVAAALGIVAAALAAPPVFAQETEEPGRARETCAEVSLDGDYKMKVPCPPGIRPLLEQLPRPAEPASRRGIVIDPDWPHDQAMVAEDDWSQDWAMVVPRADAEEEAVPLFDDLLGLSEPYLSLGGDWGDLQYGEEFDETVE